MSEKETRFTPGPWQPHLNTGSPPFVTRLEENSGWICQTVTWCGIDEAKANASLIAAAPDLYEALVFAKAQLEAYERAATGETYNSPLINVALSKALGETP